MGSCGEQGPTGGPVPVATVSITPTSLGLTVGQTGQLTATARDAAGNMLVGRQVTWASANPAVATVTAGLVTAVAPGMATVTATSEGQSGGAAVTVTMARPTLVQSVTTASTGNGGSPGPGVGGMDVLLPNASLSGNCIIYVVMWRALPGVTITTPTDDQANTYTTGPARSGTPGFISMAAFYALNAKAGVRRVSFTFSGGTPTDVVVHASEWYNIATSAGADGSSTAQATTSTTSWATGAITPGTSGDLIYQVAADNSGPPPYTSFTAQASPAFTLQVGDLLNSGVAAQWLVQVSAAPVTPTITAAPAGGYVSVAFALKSAAAGTAPAAGGPPRIVNKYHTNTAHFATLTSNKFQFPSTGNLILVNAQPGEFIALNSVTDSKGNAYTQDPNSPVNFNPVNTALFYASSATPGQALTLTLNWASAKNLGAAVTFYDITNAASSPRDTSAAATGWQMVNGNLTTVSITPAGANELVIWAGDQDNETVYGLVGARYLFDNPIWINPKQDLNGTGGANNEFTVDAMQGHYNTTDRSPLTFVLIESPGDGLGLQKWVALAVAFKAPAGGL